MELEQILNEAISKALIGKDRIRGVVDSNKIGQFVIDYLSTNGFSESSLTEHITTVSYDVPLSVGYKVESKSLNENLSGITAMLQEAGCSLEDINKTLKNK